MRAAWAPPWWMASCGLRWKLLCSKVTEGYIYTYVYMRMTFHWQTKKWICLRWACANNLKTILYLETSLSLAATWSKLPGNLCTAAEVAGKDWGWKHSWKLGPALNPQTWVSLVRLALSSSYFPVSPHRSVMICHDIKWYIDTNIIT